MNAMLPSFTSNILFMDLMQFSYGWEILQYWTIVVHRVNLFCSFKFVQIGVCAVFVCSLFDYVWGNLIDLIGMRDDRWLFAEAAVCCFSSVAFLVLLPFMVLLSSKTCMTFNVCLVHVDLLQ